MMNIVSQEDPDFIAFTGDMVAGGPCQSRVIARIQLEQDQGMVRGHVEPMDDRDSREEGALRIHARQSRF